MSFTGEKILILGAGGFVGNRLYHKLPSKGNTIVGTDRKGMFHQIDVLKDNWQAFIFEIQPTVIINCIAYGNSNHHNNKDLIKQTVFDFAVDLITFCIDNLKLTAFVQFGSSSEYGDNCNFANEDFELKPNSDYSKYKGALSAFCEKLIAEKEFPLIYYRLFSIYGPGEPESRLVPTLLRAASKGEFPQLGDADISRDFVYVDDVVDAVNVGIQKAKNNPGIYNICSGRNTRLKEICEIVKHQFQLSVTPIFGTRENHKWDLIDWCGNPEKVNSELGWKARTSLEDGLMKFRQEKNRREISIVLPIYHQANQTDSLKCIYEALLQMHPQVTEVIFAVNGNDLQSFEAFKKLASPIFKVVFTERSGWGAGVQLGIAAAKNQWVCYSNSARTHLEDFEFFLKSVGEPPNNTLYKAQRSDRGLVRSLLSKLLELEFFLCSGFYEKDINATPKLLAKKMFIDLKVEEQSDFIDAELTLKILKSKSLVQRVKIRNSKRIGGKSSTNFKTALNFLFLLPRKISNWRK